MKNLFERLKPEYRVKVKNFSSLNERLKSIKSISDLKLLDIWMLESELSISLKHMINIFELFEDEKE